jgi:protein phosphatase
VHDELEAARDARTAPSRLAALATSDERQILAAVAGNPSTPPDVLWSLAERFPAAVASNPLLEVMALGDPAALSALSEETVLAFLNEETTPPWLQAIALLSPNLVQASRLQLARAPRTTDAVLLALALSGNAQSRSVLAGRPSLPSDVEAMLVRDACDDIRLRMALRPGLSEQATRTLQGDESAVVRLATSAWTAGEAVAGPPLELPHGVATDLGQREYNEDAAAVVPLPGALLAVVADGMGGGNLGNMAATLAIERISHTLAWLLPRVLAAERGLALLAALFDANQAICEASLARERRGMGAAVAALLLDRQRAIIAHVGNSRVYRLRGGKLEALARDQSFDMHIPALGIYDPEYPGFAQIIQVLGRDVQGLLPKLREEELQPGDIFALCTDGVHGYASEVAMQEAMALTPRDPELAAGALVAAGLEEGSEDNATAIVVVVHRV